jgi:hypothetical protein
MAQHVWVGRRGVKFEDCWRLAVMLDDLDPRDKLEHLMFDFGNNRISSTQLAEHFRDKVLSFGNSLYSVWHT